MILEGNIGLKWKENILVNCDYQRNKNSKIITKLQENLSIITEHNLTLLELKSAKNQV